MHAQVMQMFDKAEAEYSELSDKKRIVETDKAKIEKVTLELCVCPRSCFTGRRPWWQKGENKCARLLQ